MNKRRKIVCLIGLSCVSVLALAACGGGGTSGGGDDKVDTSKFSVMTSNKDAAIEGQTLEIAVVNDSPFAGLFSPILSKDAYDTYFMAPTGFGTIYDMDENGKIKDGGPANFKLDRDSKTGTVTLRDDLMWSDGTPVTADDYIGTMKIIADKDYTGVRYSDITDVVGVEDFHAGKADDISGLKKVDDHTIEVTYTDVSPGTELMGSGGTLNYVVPYAQLKDIPVKDLESSDPIRKHPLSFGPFVVNAIVPGESVELKVNEHFYGDKPKVDKIVLKNTSSDAVTQSLQAKQFDLVFSMPTDSFDKYKDTAGYEMLGTPEMSYSYIGFKLGKFDSATNKNIMDEHAKMNNVSLRQAMGYALDQTKVGEKFYFGLRTQANTLIVPAFGDLSAPRSMIPGYGHEADLDKANKLLDEAGYKKGDDGMRTDPDGKDLVINFASMSGTDIAEPLSQYYIQQWQEIGLNVKLVDGRLLDFQTFYQRVQDDDPGIDVFQGAWSLDWNPDPTSLYSESAAFNMTRYVSDENTKLIKDIASDKSFDDAHRKEAFLAWQKYASEQAFVIPTLFRTAIYPVSERVTNLDMGNTASAYDVWSTVGVSKADR